MDTLVFKYQTAIFLTIFGKINIHFDSSKTFYVI